MYFTMNLAFTNYLDVLPDLTELLTLIRDRTHYEQPLPKHLHIPHYDNSLNNRPSKLKEFLVIIYKIQTMKKFLICKKGIQHTHFHLTKFLS